MPKVNSDRYIFTKISIKFRKIYNICTIDQNNAARWSIPSLKWLRLVCNPPNLRQSEKDIQGISVTVEPAGAANYPYRTVATYLCPPLHVFFPGNSSGEIKATCLGTLGWTRPINFTNCVKLNGEFAICISCCLFPLSYSIYSTYERFIALAKDVHYSKFSTAKYIYLSISIL